MRMEQCCRNLAGKYNGFCWLTVKQMSNAYVNCSPNMSLLNILTSFLRSCHFGSDLQVKYLIRFCEEAAHSTVTGSKLCGFQYRKKICICFITNHSTLCEIFLHTELILSKRVCRIGCVFSIGDWFRLRHMISPLWALFKNKCLCTHLTISTSFSFCLQPFVFHFLSILYLKHLWVHWKQETVDKINIWEKMLIIIFIFVQFLQINYILQL